MISKPDREWFATGRIAGIDFDEKTVEFRYGGDLPPTMAGAYAMISADAYRSLKMQADLWKQSAANPTLHP